MTTQTIGSIIKALRTEAGLTPTQLAIRIGCTPWAVYSWEREQNHPNTMWLIALADFFDVSLDEMVGRRHK